MGSDPDGRVFHYVDREMSPAFWLNQVGGAALARAQESDSRAFLEIVTAQLMCALTMEAVLNHVGALVFEKASGEPQVWAAIERLRPRDKLGAIAERLQLELDHGSPPFQDFRPMFRFRDQLVHGKSVYLRVDEVPDHAIDEKGYVIESELPELQTPWEQVCDVETAQRWRTSVRRMSKALCTPIDCIDPVLAGDSTSWSASAPRDSA